MANKARQPNKDRRRRVTSPATSPPRPGRRGDRRRRINRSRVWHIVDWLRLYESDPKMILANSRYAMQYIRWWIGGNTDGTVHQSEVESRKRAIINAGGYELLGIAAELLCVAGNRPREQRGYLVNHLTEPDSEAQIAEKLGLDVKRATWALRTLRRPEIAFIERVDWNPDGMPDRPREADADGADAPGADVPPSRPDAAETPPEVPRAGGAAQDKPTPPDATGGASDEGAGARKPGTIPGQDQDQGKEKDVDLTVNGRRACARIEKTEGQATDAHTGVDVAASEAAAAGDDRSGRDVVAGSGPPTGLEPGGMNDVENLPTDPSHSNGGPGESGDDRTDPEVVSSDEWDRYDDDYEHPPTGLEPDGVDDGESRPASPAHPDCPDEELWKDIKRDRNDPTTWNMIYAGRHGANAFSVMIYRQLGFSEQMSKHLANPEYGAFRGSWRNATATPLPEPWLLGLCEASIGKARQIADQVMEAAHRRAKEIEKPGAVWCKWFGDTLSKAVQAYARAKRAGTRSGPPKGGATCG